MSQGAICCHPPADDGPTAEAADGVPLPAGPAADTTGRAASQAGGTKGIKSFSVKFSSETYLF